MNYFPLSAVNQQHPLLNSAVTIAVSGYNASGKSTLVNALTSELDTQHLESQKVRFDGLYLSNQLTRKKKRTLRPSETGSLSLRKLEGQRGEWDRPFRTRQLVDVLWATVRLNRLRKQYRQRVLVFDRYFHDRMIHFNPNGGLYRLAERFVPDPELMFVLLPEQSIWEQRILERIQNRFNISIDQLSEEDRSELAHVRNRYERLLTRKSDYVRIDSGTVSGCNDAILALTRTLNSRIPQLATEKQRT